MVKWRIGGSRKERRDREIDTGKVEIERKGWGERWREKQRGEKERKTGVGKREWEMVTETQKRGI